MGTHLFPEVLLNDISGPDGDSLLLSLKLAVDVLVSNCAIVFLKLSLSKSWTNFTWPDYSNSLIILQLLWLIAHAKHPEISMLLSCLEVVDH